MNIATIDWINLDDKKKQISSTAKDHFYFCGGNTGNLIHLNAYEKILSNHSLNSFELSDTNFINSQDLLLIKCANQIGKHCNPIDILSFIEQIDIPIIMCCLGAQHENFDNLDILPQDNKWPELLKIISSKRISDHPNISVRGEYSQKVLDFYGIESTVTGCISTLLFEDNLGTILKNKYKNKKINSVCVAGNHPYNQVSIWLEKELKSIIQEYNGIHIAQSPLEIFKLVHGEDMEISDSFLKIYHMNDEEELKRWFVRYGRMFYNTDHWSYVMKLYDMVIGTRYHGVSIGLQNETLGTIFYIDSRTKELATTNGIKHIDVNALKNKNHKEILEMSMWQEDDYSYLDQQINYCKNQFDLFFNQNGVKLKHNA